MSRSDTLRASGPMTWRQDGERWYLICSGPHCLCMIRLKAEEKPALCQKKSSQSFPAHVNEIQLFVLVFSEPNCVPITQLIYVIMPRSVLFSAWGQ